MNFKLYLLSFFQLNYLFNWEQRIMEENTILFHADYQDRLEVTNYYVGMAMGFLIPEKNDNVNRLYLGCFYRSNDAIIPYVGLLLNKYKVDPALATGPFITTVNDIFGLFLYFLIGHLMYL
mgnify:CR=1 FL=1